MAKSEASCVYPYVDIDHFLYLFAKSERQSVVDAIEKGASFALLSGYPVLYLGSLPARGSVFLSSLSLNTEESRREMYMSALEASLAGISVVAEADAMGDSSVLQGVEDGEGRLHLATALALSDYLALYPERSRRILLTGGGIIAATATGRDRRAARELAASLSSFAFLAIGNGMNPIASMLDEGKDVAITRSSLHSKAGRVLAREGCPVADSLSLLIPEAKAIVYPSSGGPFSFDGVSYSYARLC